MTGRYIRVTSVTNGYGKPSQLQSRERVMSDGTGSGTTDQDYIRQIERLTAGRDIQKDNAKRWEALAMQYKREIERLQARVEVLEAELLLMDETIRNSLKYVGLAATEQEEPTVCFICGEALDTMGRCNYHSLPVAATDQVENDE